MTAKITLSKDLCSIEVIQYVARRYGADPKTVLIQYLRQEGILKDSSGSDTGYELAPNEMAIFRDLGVIPSYVDFD